MRAVSGWPRLLLALAVLAVTEGVAADLVAQGKRFAIQAEPIGSGETSVRRGAFDTTVSLESEGLDLPYTLRVSRSGRLFERSFAFGLSAEVLWSPDLSRFAITGSAEGANGQFLP